MNRLTAFLVSTVMLCCASAWGMSAQELMNEYEANSVACAKKYDNQRMSVTGTVESVSKVPLGGICVTLQPGLNCFLGWFQKEKAESIRAGEQITVTGRCHIGSIMGPSMEKCSID